MPQIINTNLASLNAQRNLNTSQKSQATAMQRLSSGLRINSAKDDAAGLAISTRFTTQTKGLAVAVRNAGDGISLAQTAEGALGSITDSLQRIRELALQAANGTNSDDDRKALNAEAQQLIAEIGRTAEQTNFNGRKLLDGSFSSSFQIGTNVGESINVAVAEMTTGTLGVAQSAGVSSTNRFTTTAAVDTLENSDLTINGVGIDGAIASDDNLSYAGKAGSAIAVAAAINKKSDLTGVTATANPNVVSGTNMTAAALTGTLTINGVTTASISTTTDAASSRAAVVAGINAISDQTGVRAIDTGENATGVELIADDGRNISISATTLTAAATGIRGADGTEDTQVGSVTLRSKDGSEITIGGDTSLESSAGFVRGSYNGVQGQGVSLSHEVAAQTGAITSTGALLSGDLVINGVSIGGAKATDDTASSTAANSSNKAGSSIAIAAAINRVSDATGVTAVVNENTIKGTSGATATAGDTAVLWINGFNTDAVTSVGDQAKDRTATVDAINRISGQTGVTAVDTGDGLELKAADGRNISLVVHSTGGTLTATEVGLNGANGVVNHTASAGAPLATVTETAYGTVSLVSAGKIEVRAGSNGIAELEEVGFRAGDYGTTEDGQFLKDVDLSTLDGANKALGAIDNALNQVNSQRADLGAIQNRFETTSSNLAVNSENLEAANSRIRDADFAAETANMSRSQVLQQAGISILAQANQLPQNVLSLLR